MSVGKSFGFVSFSVQVFVLALTSTLFPINSAWALREPNLVDGDDQGAVVVYDFQTSSKDTPTEWKDVSSRSPNSALNLVPSAAGNTDADESLLLKLAIPWPLIDRGSVKAFSAVLLNNKGDYQGAQVHRTFLRTRGPAAKINSECSSGFTLQAFIRPQFGFHGDREVRRNENVIQDSYWDSSTKQVKKANGVESQRLGNLIAALTNTAIDPTTKEYKEPLASGIAGGARLATPNFGIYQVNGGSEGPARVMLRMRGVQRGPQNEIKNIVPLDFVSTPSFSSLSLEENTHALNEVIATWDAANGRVSVYLNRSPQHYKIPAGFHPEFTDYAHLVLGNDLVALDKKSSSNTENRDFVRYQRNWSGEIHHLAIYCKGFTEQQILGERALNKIKEEAIKPNPNLKITTETREARKMATRLAGVRFPVDHPLVIEMAEKIRNGDRLGAAQIITGDRSLGLQGHPQFFNITLRNMALPMSNRQETTRAPLNDFVASFIGVTRDETNAKELLTGNFFYLADPAKASVPSNLKSHLYERDEHYRVLGDPENNWDLAKVLRRVDDQNPLQDVSGRLVGQFVITSSNGVPRQHPDPAGVLSSRAFMSEHAVAGTNRRLVEYAFKSFTCLEMAEIADTGASTLRIGRDVERSPAGDNSKFETSCKGCHTVMDGYRGAFSKVHFDFVGESGMGIFKHTQTHPSSGQMPYGFAATGASSIDPGAPGIVRKLNHNENNFMAGYRITDESFVNNADRQQQLFGWRGEFARGGTGIRQFGQMIADSKRFSFCMAKRVYETLCLPGNYKVSDVSPMLNHYAERFEASGYKLRRLFQEIAANASCIQLKGGI